MFKLLFPFIAIPLISFGQNVNETPLTGEQYAKQEIKAALINTKVKPFYDTLIGDKETAIAVVEPILFKFYGKEEILSERPYETYFINGYWYICGTLLKEYKGGTFEIIINSINGQVIKLAHGK
jgi:hypothetical protein